MKHTFIVAGLGAASWGIYLAVTLSAQSLHEEGTGGRSLLLLLALFAAAFLLYLAALRAAVRAPQDRRLVSTILSGAVLFRTTLLFSDPIEEVDLYRYLWDGIVATHGVNPFRYTPRQVLEAPPRVESRDDLDRLAALRDRSPVVREILSRVHFGQLPTIYPPVSQAVFALNAALTPIGASLYWRMVLMKAWFVVCDLGTVLLVLRLLRQTGKPVGWLVAYAWCPLVLKEVANSGHVDSLAVLLAVVALSLTVQAVKGEGRASKWLSVLAAILLALATGAKLFPIILTPWFVIAIVAGRGWRTAVVSGCSFAVTTVVLLFPMMPWNSLAPLDASPEPAASDLPPLPPIQGGDVSEPHQDADPSQSVRAFLSEWEMNDFLFLVVMENVRPVANLPPEQIAWFSIVPESWRVTLTNPVSRTLDTTSLRAAFLWTRSMLGLTFMVLAIGFAWRGLRNSSPDRLLEAAFLTLAWFWLLLPTQNPWYCTWFLPLLPFARSKVWILLSGLALIYYFRFWLVFHFPDPGVLGTRYAGGPFFDFVVTWVEFAPWLTLLFMTRAQGQPNDAAPVK